ncbi:MAG: glycosyltransferase family 39 protein [Thermoplasmatales archaeon]|nr:glycosyltransferase family 39 protein [Thermoplasmatales archaeon]
MTPMNGVPDEPTIQTWSELYLQGKYSVPLDEFMQEHYNAPQSIVVEQNGEYFVANEKGPGYCVLLAGFILLGIEPFVVVFLGIITCVSTYFLARRLFNWKVAFISTLLVITCTDALLMLQRYGHPDYATMAFAVLGLWLFIESLHTFYGNSENKLLYGTALGIAGGVALGFSVTTRYAVVFLLLVLFIYFPAVNYNLLRKSFASFIRSSKFLLPYVIGVLIPMFLLLNYNATVLGAPFESGYNFEQIITVHPEIPGK